jgi:YD repeat-containing protein
LALAAAKRNLDAVSLFQIQQRASGGNLANLFRVKKHDSLDCTGFRWTRLSGWFALPKTFLKDSVLITPSVDRICRALFMNPSGPPRKKVGEARSIRNRVTQVFEDPNSLNYETDYVYTPLNDVQTVTQKGGSSSSNWRTRSFSYDSLSRLTSATNPESGMFTYSDDANGNLTSKVAPLHNQTGTSTVTTTYNYDALNRIASKAYTDGTPTVRYGYDGSALSGCTTAPPSVTDPYPVGRRTAMCDGSGATSWSHDQMGRIASETRTIKGNSVVTKTTTYVHNVDGSLQSTTYPGGYYVYNGYDQAQRTNFVGDLANPGVSYIDDATYTPSGLLTGSHGADTGNGPLITNSFTYNNRLQPTSISGATTSNTIFSLSYAYGPTGQNNGNISTITNSLDATRTVNFNYDSLNRIANALTTNWGEAYTIDAWGNMTAINAYQGKAHESFSCGPANTQNQLNTCYGYDSAGNLVTNSPNAYTYDAENRLVSTAGWTYVYDGDGNRVKKSSSSGTLYIGLTQTVEFSARLICLEA